MGASEGSLKYNSMGKLMLAQLVTAIVSTIQGTKQFPYRLLNCSYIIYFIPCSSTNNCFMKLDHTKSLAVSPTKKQCPMESPNSSPGSKKRKGGKESKGGKGQYKKDFRRRREGEKSEAVILVLFA
jgi:hypothetical protein